MLTVNELAKRLVRVAHRFWPTEQMYSSIDFHIGINNDLLEQWSDALLEMVMMDNRGAIFSLSIMKRAREEAAEVCAEKFAQRCQQ